MANEYGSPKKVEIGIGLILRLRSKCKPDEKIVMITTGKGEIPTIVKKTRLDKFMDKLFKKAA